jgi:O-antigen/teichoic acid export membrane protein
VKNRESPIEGALKDVGSLVTGRFVSAASQAVMVVWLLSAVPTSEFGFLLTWFSLSLVISGITDFGFTSLILISMKSSEDYAKRILGADTFITFCLVCAALVVAFSTSLLTPKVENLHILNATVLVVWGLLETLTEAGNMVQLGSGQAWRAGVSIALRRLVGLASFVALSSAGLSSVAFPLGLMTGTIVAYLLLPKAWLKKSVITRELLTSLRPFAVVGAVAQVKNLDVPLFTTVFGTVGAASYALGARLANPVLIIAGSVGNVVVGSKSKIQRRQLLWILFLGVSSVFVTLYLGPLLARSLSSAFTAIIPFLTSEETLIAILVLARFLMTSIAAVFSSALINLGRVELVAKLNLLTAIAACLVILGVGFLSNNLLLTVGCSISLYSLQVLALFTWSWISTEKLTRECVSK